MREFGKTSKKRLATCHEDLQRLFNEVIKRVDCTVLCGHRGELEQNQAFKDGKSKVKYPDSKHNTFPSLAVDVGPWPLYWYDLKSFDNLAKIVYEVAKEMGIASLS